ncbi:unnamed protein product [Durusdinium trenchii]
MLLENVAHIISDNLREIPDYLLEESRRRGLEMKCCTVDGHMLGAPVWRQRVFVLIKQPGFQFGQALPTKKWMKGSKSLPMSKWLVGSRSPDDRERIAGVGNVVIPLMAFFAANILCDRT